MVGLGAGCSEVGTSSITTATNPGGGPHGTPPTFAPVVLKVLSGTVAKPANWPPAASGGPTSVTKYPLAFLGDRQSLA